MLYNNVIIFLFKINAYAKIGIFEGIYKNDQRNVFGIWKYSNGDVYEGEFKDHKIEGFGKKTDRNGKIIHNGNWKEGQPVL